MTDNETNNKADNTADKPVAQISFYNVGFSFTELTEGTVVVSAKDEESAKNFLLNSVPDVVKDFKITSIEKVAEDTPEYEEFSQQFSENNATEVGPTIN